MFILRGTIMNKRIYIVEGEIEVRFLKQLIEAELISPGRIYKFNLMQEELKPISSILTKKVDEIFAIIDTDCIEDVQLKNIVNNIKTLKKIGKLFVLVQNKNFEDELMTIFEQSNIQNLCRFFKLKNHSKTDLKVYLCQKVKYSDKINKENIKKYCSCYGSFQQILINKSPKLSVNIVNAEKL